MEADIHHNNMGKMAKLNVWGEGEKEGGERERPLLDKHITKAATYIR